MNSTMERPVPREITAIFNDLQAAMNQSGALHYISYIVYRDWVLTIDKQAGKVVDDPQKRWSDQKINKNELMLLLGLLIKSTHHDTYNYLPLNLNAIEVLDTLLREFHDALLSEFLGAIETQTMGTASPETTIGAFAREAIYYGAESFYLAQLEHFSKHRYRLDRVWLQRNVGLSIKTILKIARFITDRVNAQITAAKYVINDDPPDIGLLTSSLSIAKRTLHDRFQNDASMFLKMFSTPPLKANGSFSGPFEINQANLRPLVDLDEHVYVPSQYRLFESIYESPFYWMIADAGYKDTAAENRGEFLEATASALLTSIFGKRHVFRNALINLSKKETAAEADVLVVYGEFVIVVQAKSKRLTLKARSGDTEALTLDYKRTIEDPYRQAMRFSECLRAGMECTSQGVKVLLPKNPRIFPMILLSDAFPSITILSSMIIKDSAPTPPVIWDIGVLDCVTKLLPTPIDFIFYLKCRSDNFSKIHSDSEYNFLGFHIKHKLAAEPDADYQMIERAFAAPVDDFMISLDVGGKPKRPISILERIKIPIISDLLVSLRNAPPSMASIVIDLYDYSSDTLKRMGSELENMRREVSGGKALKALSISTEHGGVSYVACRKTDRATVTSAELIGKKHKYDQRRDRWYVILDCVNTKQHVDAVLPLLDKWEENAEMAKTSDEIARYFGSTYKKMSDGNL
jgi:hypothetical protein